jgi:hypothetical protein
MDQNELPREPRHLGVPLGEIPHEPGHLGVQQVRPK